MGHKNILAYDDLESRREMVRLLGDPHLTDRHRLGFVRWCSKRCGDDLVKVEPVKTKTGYGVQEAMLDLSMLTLQYRLDIDTALAELTRRVRRF